MKERPILFSGPMVRAILDGRKTMTRRVVKLRYGADVVVTNGQVWKPARVDYAGYVDCPYGQVGDRLWAHGGFIAGRPSRCGCCASNGKSRRWRYGKKGQK